jgi:hypothetical protein
VSAPSTATIVPRIIHIGAFDLASYGDQIFPLVAAHELRRRLGEVELVPFGPVGSTGTATGVGRRSWALGPWTADRATEVARRATLVLCGGGEFVHGDGGIYAPFYGIDHRDACELRMDRWFVEVLGAAEVSCPVVWHAPGVPAELDDDAERIRAAVTNRALLAVRDERSRTRLEAAGVEREVDVVPDSALLLPRALAPDRLDEHRARLRTTGHYPDNGPVVVVQGNHTMGDFAAPLARALADEVPDARVALVSVSPCHDDGRFADEVAAALPGRAWRVPDDSPLEAVTAAIAGADCFVGVSLHGAITAYAYGRPHVTFDPFGQPKLEGLADLLGASEWIAHDPAAAAGAVARRLAGASAARDPRIEARIDAHFDRVAELCEARRDVPVEPLTWTDTAATLHLSLRRVPRRVDPAPVDAVAGMRRPDIEPTRDDLVATLATVLAARTQQRAEVVDNQAELARLRAENRDLRGALAHLEGIRAAGEARVAAAEQAQAEVAAILAGARSSRTFRLTGRPAALRRVPTGAVADGAVTSDQHEPDRGRAP